MTLKIIFWNTRSFMARRLEIEKMIVDLDIFICVESWLPQKNQKNQQTISFPGFVTFRKDRQHANGGGILIFIRNNIAFQEINNLSSSHQSVEICGLKINNYNPVINLIVCYRAPGLLTQTQWDSITENILENECSILFGDFNAHNTNWNCKNTDSNGKKFGKSIEKSNLFVHNHDTLTHLDVYRNNKSNIDLVLSSMNIAEKISVKVYDETLGSDHFPIYLTIETEKFIYKKKSFKISSLRTNWNNVESYLKERANIYFTPEFNNLSPVSKYDFFINNLRESIIHNTPKKKVNRSHATLNPVSWWDEDCDRVKRLRRAAFRKWEFTNDSKDLIAYNKSCATAKKTFKIKKKEDFKKFASSIDHRTNPSYVWNKCKVFKNKWIKITPTHCSQNKQEVDKIMAELEKTSPPCVITDPDKYPKCNKNEFFDEIFNFTEFNIALSSMNANSAPGMDGISFNALQNMPLNYKLILLDIFNEMFQASEFPQSWKESFIHFIDKSDKIGVRPISLTSCLCKFFETLIKNRLQWWVEYLNIIPINQCGFRKGRSCADNLTNLLLFTEEALFHNQDVYVAFLDVNSAFPSVNIDILLNTLASIDCSENLVKFIKHITHERYIFTDTLGDQYRIVGKGVPQGGVLSPLLFIIYTSKILENIPVKFLGGETKISLFADDIELHSKNKKELEDCISIISKNLQDLDLNLSPKKTKFLHINNKNILPGQTSIKVDEFRIKSSETARFLGINFDYKLSFSNQVNEIEKKCRRALNIIKFLNGTWWGSHPDTLIVLYKSYIRSIIDYGCFIYFPKTSKLI